MTEPMDIYFAMFNIRRGERTVARHLFIEKYGLERYEKSIAPYWRKGIMSIFHDKPTRPMMFYAKTVKQLVNKRIERNNKKESN